MPELWIHIGIIYSYSNSNNPVIYFHWKILALAGIWIRDLPVPSRYATKWAILAHSVFFSYSVAPNHCFGKHVRSPWSACSELRCTQLYLDWQFWTKYWAYLRVVSIDIHIKNVTQRVTFELMKYKFVLSWLIILDLTYKLSSLDYILD